MDVNRYQQDLAALAPSHQLSLLSLSGIDRRFGNGYLQTGRWGWNGLSAASRRMLGMLEHRRFDFPECPIQTRIPERIRNLRGLRTSTLAERRRGVSDSSLC